MLIRRETPADIPAVQAVTAAAFAAQGAPAPVEVALLEELRTCDAWIPELSLVAVGDSGEVVGHVVCTRGHVDGAPAAWVQGVVATPLGFRW
ncbi:hypothetical protein ACFW9F_23450 [Streptomyces sp. NPDC059506]|uniref:hypothetical protein n=1 Tax=Streptomyces sp. NPDC059506 TaxID=3347751 RepID=UPI00367C7CDB